ncbi:hypothetical protein YC2023_034204 [Brassica napus]
MHDTNTKLQIETGSFGCNGDTDGKVPVTSMSSKRYSIKKMRLKVESPWSREGHGFTKIK